MTFLLAVGKKVSALAKHYICNYFLCQICRCQHDGRNSRRYYCSLTQLIKHCRGLRSLSSQLLRNRCFKLAAAMLTGHGFWPQQSLRQQLFTLPPRLKVSFFPFSQRKPVTQFRQLFDATALSNRIHLLSVFIATLMREVTPTGRYTHRTILTVGSYCATARTAWTFTCPLLFLGDHGGSPVFESLPPARGQTPQQ